MVVRPRPWIHLIIVIITDVGYQTAPKSKNGGQTQTGYDYSNTGIIQPLIELATQGKN